jgi:soluble lytic murein transglycosylase-like protein
MMADEVASSAQSHEPGLGIRTGRERRHGDRRSRTRLRGNRRRRDRRRAGLHGLLFTAAAFAIPNQMTPAKVSSVLESVLSPALEPRVGVSIDSFNPIPAAHAYDDLIREAAEEYHLEPSLIRSVMRTESAFNPFAVSTAGAMGLMQLMPEIQKAFGVDDPFDPRQNIMAGARLLRELLDQHHGNLVLTIASYNAGPTAIANHGNKVPPFRETQNYVKRVTNLIADERAGTD